MTVAEKLIQRVQVLPENVQAEVMDFVECLEAKTRVVREDPGVWGEFSLSQALSGMESELSPYSIHDLKEIFT